MLEEISKYIVIWLAIAALAASFVWILVKFVLAVIADRKWNRESHTAEEHLDRWAFLAGYSKEDLEPEVGPEQVAERPHVELHEDEVNRVFEWDDWGKKSVLKS